MPTALQLAYEGNYAGRSEQYAAYMFTLNGVAYLVDFETDLVMVY